MNSISSDLAEIAEAAPITAREIEANRDLLREIRDQFEALMMVDSALFFTDKLMTATPINSTSSSTSRAAAAGGGGSEEDQMEVEGTGEVITGREEAYRMAKLLAEKEEFHRAAHYLTHRSLHKIDLSCRYLAAKCHYDCREFSKALEILALPVPPVISYDSEHGTLNEWQSSIELLKGHVFEVQGDREEAKKAFLGALRLNVFSYEAFQAFTRFDMLSKDEEKELLSIIAFDKKKFTSSPDQYIKYFYLSELNKNGDYNAQMSEVEQMMKMSSLGPITSNISTKTASSAPKTTTTAVSSGEQQISPFSGVFSSSIDLRLNEAEQLYNDCQFNRCYKIASEIYSEDLYNPRCLLLNIGCLLELNKEVALQELSHKLVEVYPENPISWYSVGCYYYKSGAADTARKYFSKSTAMDATFQPAMLMYGHCFELESLHDQAMAVYLDLSKAMAGSFLPLLYVGVEYSHQNNMIMAERYMTQALALSQNSDNLLVLHELAIVCYQKKEYESAMRHFASVHQLLSRKHLMAQFPDKWEPLLNNMGHVCRKLGRYEQAIAYHSQALRMCPSSASSYDAIGLVYSLKGELQTACDFFQKALSLKRDDAFAMTMYNIVYQEIIDREMSQPLDAILNA